VIFGLTGKGMQSLNAYPEYCFLTCKQIPIVLAIKAWICEQILADCYSEGSPSLCTELLERGLARPYNP
jgi:hypothetical protein